MKTSERSFINIVKFSTIFLVWLLLSLFQELKAQDNPSKLKFTGIEASFGYKSNTISSNIAELDQTLLIEEGGNIGAVIGNYYSRFIIRPVGFYSAIGSYGRTVNLFAIEIENNTYLLQSLLKKPTRFDIYSSLGMNYHTYSFYGHYVQKDLRPTQEVKPGRQPLLGKVNDLMISFGMGAEYRILNDDRFLHLFITAKKNMNIQSSTNSVAFEGTELKNNIDIMLGMRFGIVNNNRHRLNR